MTPSQLPLNDRVALVTGASRGIGRAVAIELRRQGAVVIGTATTDEGARAVGEALSPGASGQSDQASTAGPVGFGERLDVTDRAHADALVESIVARHGRIDVLVNNAGITRDGLSMRMRDADWDAVLDTNLTAVFRLARAVMRGMMKARHGRIVNVTSVVASIGNAGQANYAAAKAGVEGMTRALARELGSRNVTVNCVAPGFIDTDMTRALAESQAAALVQQIPLGRLGRPEDVAAAVAFLASPSADYITGTTLHVNGGMHMS